MVFKSIALLLFLDGVCSEMQKDSPTCLSEGTCDSVASKTHTAPKVVLAYGDSNTWGFNSETLKRHSYADRWTTHLQTGLGEGYVVIPEGLNARTTVRDDSNMFHWAGDGGEGMNGRRYLSPCLYSHHPVDLVIIGLGCNDLKTRFALEPEEIAVGMEWLVMDVLKSEAGPDGKPPKVMVVSPCPCKENTLNAGWGFRGCEARSRSTVKAYQFLCNRLSIPFVNISEVAAVGSDGIHFNLTATAKIGARMVDEVKRALSV